MLTGILLAMGLLPLLLGGLLLNRYMMTLTAVTPVFLGAASLAGSALGKRRRGRHG